ncbi:hypothetical protein NP233_g11971 [Leucocoprinus birnbaumii]|uniref:UBX domain-containing protein n=1 Tax=Leucocoprinus birnbaumii TaxID=56174 RepID=A0AAD5VFA6_9AGAR|nr:hypothetical protein NP233_g11971 [Leucocoprinus birnbaumii]
MFSMRGLVLSILFLNICPAFSVVPLSSVQRKSNLPVLPNTFIVEVDDVADIPPSKRSLQPHERFYAQLKSRDVVFNGAREFKSEGPFIGATITLDNPQDVTALQDAPGVKDIRPIRKFDIPKPVSKPVVTSPTDSAIPAGSESTHIITTIRRRIFARVVIAFHRQRVSLTSSRQLNRTNSTMPSDKETLLGMGFDPARVEWAIKATSGRGLQPAMDHIFENEGKPVPDPNAVAESSNPSTAAQPMNEDDEDELAALQSLGVKGAAAAAAANATEAEAKSIKCSECGKIFKNTALANYHAEKSGHDQFEESTEEKKKRNKSSQIFKPKMAAKRAQKAVQEAQEAKANEAIRRKSGKDMNKIREELALKEAQKEAEAKKREKLEDARARAAVKAQIEADKKARAEKAAMEKALREGRADPGATAPVDIPKPAAAAAATAGTAGRDFKDTRLQIRMSTGGPPLTTTLSSDAPLREVAEYIAGQNLAVDVDTVTLAQHFPRKTFTRADFSKSLRDLGLTPSAVLIATP